MRVMLRCPVCLTHVTVEKGAEVIKVRCHGVPLEDPRDAEDHGLMSVVHLGVETDGEFLARIGTDAEKWAAEFVKATGAPMDPAPGETLFAWFANAIEAGKSEGHAEARRDAEGKAQAGLRDYADALEGRPPPEVT